MAASDWQYIPTDTMRKERRKAEADTWAKRERSRLAADWADQQRRWLTQQKPPEPEAPPQPEEPDTSMDYQNALRAGIPEEAMQQRPQPPMPQPTLEPPVQPEEPDTVRQSLNMAGLTDEVMQKPAKPFTGPPEFATETGGLGERFLNRLDPRWQLGQAGKALEMANYYGPQNIGGRLANQQAGVPEGQGADDEELRKLYAQAGPEGEQAYRQRFQSENPAIRSIYEKQGPQAAWQYAMRNDLGAQILLEAGIDPLNIAPIGGAIKAAQKVGPVGEALLRGAKGLAPEVPRVARELALGERGGAELGGIAGKATEAPAKRTPVTGGTNTERFRQWFGGSKVADESGNPIVVYRGDYRADKLGNAFKVNKTTSGRFYFTQDPEIASNYAVSKPDVHVQEELQDYENWFQFPPDKGTRTPNNLRSQWYRLTTEEQAKAKDVLLKTGHDDDGVLDFSGQHPLAAADHWAREVRQARGNWLQAAKEVWLNSGTLFDDEEQFIDILRQAGLKNVKFDSPRLPSSAVTPVYLNIRNPLDTSSIPPEVIERLRAVAKADRTRGTRYGADQWDKNINTKVFMDRLESDYAEGTTYSWTQVPEKITKALQQMGYDGIKDTGGKMGGPKHIVWIAFEPTQIKSVFNSGKWDPNKANILGQVQIGPALDLGSSAAGAATGYTTADDNATPEERLARAALGAAGGFGASRALRTGRMGLGVEDVSKGEIYLAPTLDMKPDLQATVKQILEKEQAKGRPALAIDEIIYTVNGKLMVSMEHGNVTEIRKLNELSESGLARGIESNWDETGKYTSYNDAAKNLYKKIKSDRVQAEAQSLAEQKAANESRDLTQRAEATRRQTIDAQYARSKFPLMNTEIALSNGDKMPLKGPSIGGLLISREAMARDPKKAPYTLTHIASGFAVGPKYSSQQEAKVAAMRLSNLADWTQGIDPIKADFERIAPAIRALITDGPYAPFPESAITGATSKARGANPALPPPPAKPAMPEETAAQAAKAPEVAPSVAPATAAREPLEMTIDSLIAQYEATGRTATRYPRKKQISVDGRTMSEADAISKMEGVVAAKAKGGEAAAPPTTPPAPSNIAANAATTPSAAPERPVGPATAQAGPIAPPTIATGRPRTQPRQGGPLPPQPSAATTPPAGAIPPPTTAPPVQPPAGVGVTPPARGATTPPPTAPTALNPPQGNNWLPQVPDTQTILDRAYHPDLFRNIADRIDNPVTRTGAQAIGIPSRDIFHQGLVVYETIQNNWRSAVTGAIARLKQQGDSAKLFSTDKDGRALIGTQRIAIGDVLQYPRNYALTPEQQRYAGTIHKLYDDQLGRLTENGVDVNTLPFPPGAHYVGRRAMGKIDAAGNLEVAEIRTGAGTRVGAKANFEKTRIFATEEEAIREGFRYFAPEETLEWNLNAAGRKIADQRLVNWILPQLPHRTAEAPDALKAAKEYAKDKLGAVGKLKATILRGYRGERVPEATVASIGRFFPQEAAILVQAGISKPENPITRALLQQAEAAVPTLKLAAQTDYYKARAVLAEALAHARTPHLGEGMVQAPAFAGKFFGAADAKKLNEVLDLERPGFLRGAAEAVSWVNALPRLLMTTFDLGTPLINGQIAMFSHPRVWAGAVKQAMGNFMSAQGAQAFQATYADLIRDTSQYGLMFNPSEFSAAMQPGGMATKIPGMLLVSGRFTRGYEGFLNAMRIYGWKATVHRATTETDKVALARFWNEMSGQVDTASQGISRTQRAVETATLFAPRYRRAVFGLMTDIARGDLRGVKARESLAATIAGGLTGYTGIALMMGQQPNFNPLDRKFLTVNVGGVDVGIGGAFVGTGRTLLQMAAAPAKAHEYAARYVENVMAPFPGAIERMIHYNYRYNTPWKATKELGGMFLPISVQSALLDGRNLSEGLVAGATEFLGGRSVMPAPKPSGSSKFKYPGPPARIGSTPGVGSRQFRYPGAP